ncbi:MAG: hypothetical protein PWP15_1624 [Methanothermococcus sp.]|uniref:metallophosphoesterase family protein n=1 Tax=Methanothermococcus TaxID=155862 RepID=UPI000370D5E2|nr:MULTISPECIES: metallophosphoesterase [Methanothermococcus]MDK2791104.1 hypothetical protein [Methanothermococcus sp.]MDK2977347.1 hypothetical protein [Bacteroidales bacterium]
MRILFISDLHTTMIENAQFEWLNQIIIETRPDLLLSAGDWDEGLTRNSIQPILEKIPLLTIFGNHENMQELTQIIAPSLGRSALLQDFEVVEVCGLKICGVNGIYSEKRLMKKGVPRQRGDSFIIKARNFLEETQTSLYSIDFFLCHETPELPVYSSNELECFKFRISKGSKLIMDTINLIKPKIVLNGHLHFTEYTLTRMDYGGLYIRVDSSEKSRSFAVIELDGERYSVGIHKESVENLLEKKWQV